MSKIRSAPQSGGLYAYPKAKSIRRFIDRVRQLTKRRLPLATEKLIERLNPLLRGWGHYYKRAHVRKILYLTARTALYKLRLKIAGVRP